MEKVEGENQLFDLFREINSGGLEGYDHDEQALMLRFESIGGPREDNTLYLKFLFVEYFHLPLGFDGYSEDGYGIDEIREIDKEEAIGLMPQSSLASFGSSQDDYKCYRFYANNVATPFYVYCLSLEGYMN
ncbi:MAG: hypothetical protein OQK04_01670 [Kangiellaceae bacterium]|nr:hypothetical protein [Kangiellaceae bacterium]MCW8997411.1 hypothetical protein [Kangiellaceae bacterium]